MPDDFRDAIRDLDRGHINGARQHIMNEINYGHADPYQLVRDINRVECQPGHAHQTMQLVQNNGYLDVVPANYGPPPGPPRGYEGQYEQPGYRRPEHNVAPIVGGIAAGVLLDELLHRHRH